MRRGRRSTIPSPTTAPEARPPADEIARKPHGRPLSGPRAESTPRAAFPLIFKHV